MGEVVQFPKPVYSGPWWCNGCGAPLPETREPERCACGSNIRQSWSWLKGEERG